MTTLPPLTLLEPRDLTDLEPEEDHARTITRTLAEHGQGVTVAEAYRGSAVTRYLLTLDPGVLPKRIETLSEALSVAVGAPVRYAGQIGRAIGVEVPNATRRTVRLRELIEQGQALTGLGFVVGQDVAGATVSASLAKLPHLMVAGATGQGKSAFLNAMLLSLLMRCTPDDLRFVMIDPKRVELTAYARLPHLSRPIVTEVTDAADALKDVVDEMDRRYSAMNTAGVKEIGAWNDRDDVKWPRLVVVIDELADLMMTAPKAVEPLIVRIGQLGRAAGIHLVLATQYPKADVITTKISQNVPSRIAFTVANHTASRVILGRPGAERLTGAGDALWSPVGAMHPERIQAPWVTEEEVARAVAWWVRAAEGARIQESAFAKLAADRERVRLAELERVGALEAAERAEMTAAAFETLSEPEPVAVDIPSEAAVRIQGAWHNAIHLDRRVAELEAENATLRAMIARQTELMTTLGDTLTKGH